MACVECGKKLPNFKCEKCYPNDEENLKGTVIIKSSDISQYKAVTWDGRIYPRNNNSNAIKVSTKFKL